MIHVRSHSPNNFCSTVVHCKRNIRHVNSVLCGPKNILYAVTWGWEEREKFQVIESKQRRRFGRVALVEVLFRRGP